MLFSLLLSQVTLVLILVVTSVDVLLLASGTSVSPLKGPLARQADEEAVQEPTQVKAAKKAARRQSRVPQVNFETMSSVDYSALR
jgi:hypothetical protein